MRSALVLVLAAVAVVAVACARETAPAKASPPQLVYICQQIPCASSQELAVADHNGAPIFSVGEYGGAAVMGDNFRLFPPGDVYDPAIILSFAPPAAYYRVNHVPVPRCKPPSKWIAPQGTWLCRAGHWRRTGP